MKLTISGNCPSQKNRKIISVNRATGRPFLRSAPAVKEWQAKAEAELREQFNGYKVTGYPIELVVTVFFDNLRRHDLDNALASVMDALSASEVIEDDNVNCVSTITVTYGGVDKLNPRVEIWLEEE